MIKVRFYNNDNIKEEQMKFAVIMSEYNDKWIMVRHKERSTWEIPGGHIEENEELEAAASRELHEETGAEDFQLFPVCTYSVARNDDKETFGKLFYAKVSKLGELPKSEISEIKLVENISGELTYPEIQPRLAEEVVKYIESNKDFTL